MAFALKKNDLALAAVIVFIILIISYFAFSGVKPAYTVESELKKDVSFAMKSGDVLVYNYSIENGSALMTYMFAKVPRNSTLFANYTNCTIVLLRDVNLSTCIGDDGTDSETNVSLSSPGFLFFSPWMLGIRGDFRWSALMRNSLDNSVIQNFSAILLRNERVLGREAFVLKTYDNGYMASANKTIWVDSERRVLLKEEGKDYNITLVQAPFPLGPKEV